VYKSKLTVPSLPLKELTPKAFTTTSINQSMVYLLTQHNSNKQYHNSTQQRIMHRVWGVNLKECKKRVWALYVSTVYHYYTISLRILATSTKH